MKSVALVTYKGSPELCESDQLLVAPLEEEGFQAHAIAWDDRVDWTQFDSIILRSCWDYHTRITEFLDWLRMLKREKVTVWNPIDVVLWNYRKTYLKELAEKGIATISTVWLEKNSSHSLSHILIERGWKKAVVKPTVGASAYEIFLVTLVDAGASQKKLDRLLDISGVMVQPLIKEVQTEGEFSVVFIGGEYSHTVLKKALANEFRSNYEYRAVEQLVEPSQEVLDQATKIYRTVEAPLLYARIDGIVVNNIFTLMELELIEPYLFFDLFPQGAERFAQALVKNSK